MTVRTKSGLLAEITRLIDSGGVPPISAQDVRSVLIDMRDSLAFGTEITGAAIVASINAQLGGTTWQTGAGTGTGVNLQAVLDAIQVNAAAADGLELTRTEGPAAVTIGLAHVTTDAAFAGWSPDRAITTNDFTTAGSNFDVAIEGTVGAGAAIPGVDAGFVAGYVWFALPQASGYPAHVVTQGFRQPDAAFTDEGMVTHDQQSFVIGVSANPLGAVFAGRLMEWEF